MSDTIRDVLSFLVALASVVCAAVAFVIALSPLVVAMGLWSPIILCAGIVLAIGGVFAATAIL